MPKYCAALKMNHIDCRSQSRLEGVAIAKFNIMLLGPLEERLLYSLNVKMVGQRVSECQPET